jgi:hypothetical protein
VKKQTRRFITGTVALIAGSLVVYAGDRLTGVQIELWWGLSTFNFLWMIAMFIVPLISGIVVAVIFGLGGKWLCYFPPLIVRCIEYFRFAFFSEVPEGAVLLVFPYWILFVILVVEAAAFGGVIGEIMVKRTYGRLPRELVYRGKRDRAASESNGQG